MARTATPVTTAYNTGAAPTATNLDPTNGHTIPVTTCPADELLIIINNTTVSAKIVTLKAGAYPPALSAGQGDLAITCAASTNGIPIRIESGRFMQADGTIYVDVAASTTGTINVYRVSSV